MKQAFAQNQITQKAIQLFALLIIFMIGLSFNVEAQRDGREDVDDYFDESGVGGFRFWYGGGLGLGFSGGTFSNQFNLSVSPMVGYKITPEFSVGPRGELSYTHFRTNDGRGGVEKYNFFNYGIGAFSRYKLFQQFFIHAEYQIESRQLLQGVNKIRRSRNNFYVGAGYTSGGLVGYEISLLWNLLEEDTIDLPIDYRIAFTYNF